VAQSPGGELALQPSKKWRNYMARTLTKAVARRQDQTFADWFAELRELAGDRWAEVADQAPTVYVVWGGGARPRLVAGLTLKFRGATVEGLSAAICII
jgi:hypothetical protein